MWHPDPTSGKQPSGNPTTEQGDKKSCILRPVMSGNMSQHITLTSHETCNTQTLVLVSTTLVVEP